MWHSRSACCPWNIHLQLRVAECEEGCQPLSSELHHWHLDAAFSTLQFMTKSLAKASRTWLWRLMSVVPLVIIPEVRIRCDHRPSVGLKQGKSVERCSRTDVGAHGLAGSAKNKLTLQETLLDLTPSCLGHSPAAVTHLVCTRSSHTCCTSSWVIVWLFCIYSSDPASPTSSTKPFP